MKKTSVFIAGMLRYKISFSDISYGIKFQVGLFHDRKHDVEEY